MTQSTYDLFATLGLICLIAIPLGLLLAWLERPRYRIQKGRSVKLNTYLR